MIVLPAPLLPVKVKVDVVAVNVGLAVNTKGLPLVPERVYVFASASNESVSAVASSVKIPETVIPPLPVAAIAVPAEYEAVRERLLKVQAVLPPNKTAPDPPRVRVPPVKLIVPLPVRSGSAPPSPTLRSWVPSNDPAVMVKSLVAVTAALGVHSPPEPLNVRL